MSRPVESSEWRFRSPCEIWKRFGFRCVSCRLRYRSVRVAVKR